MYQQITLIGNLGSDPELRHTAAGVPVCSFRLAVNRQWHAQDGEQKEKVTWVRITAWQKLAEVANEHLRKGRRILVVGELENPQAYVNKAGEAAATNEVTARTIRFMDTAADQETQFEESGMSSDSLPTSLPTSVPVAAKAATPVATKPIATKPPSAKPLPAKSVPAKERRTIDIPF